MKGSERTEQVREGQLWSRTALVWPQPVGQIQCLSGSVPQVTKLTISQGTSVLFYQTVLQLATSRFWCPSRY